MEKTPNRSLIKSAQSSALSKCTTPLFLCDMNLHLCMFTEKLEHYKPLFILGKSMIGILPADLPEQLQKDPDGILMIPVMLPDYNGHIIALRSEAEGEPCIVCILQVFDPSLLSQNKEYLRLSRLRIASAVHNLLKSKSTADDKLSFACTQLTRLLNISRYTASADSDNMLPLPNLTELVPYISTALIEFTPPLASVGGNISIIRNNSPVFFCSCTPVQLGVVLALMITAAFCRSADGMIRLAIDSENNAAAVSIIVSYSASKPIGNLDDLINSLHALQLDLLAAKEIAAHAGIGLDCISENGRLIIRILLKRALPGVLAFHAPTQTADVIFLRNFITQLLALCTEEMAQT